MTVGAGRHVAAGLAVAAMLLGVVLYEFFVWFPTPDWIAMMAGMASVPAAVLFAFVAWALPSVRTPFRRMAILLVPITVGIGWAAFSAWSAQMTTLASALSALLWTAPPVFALAAAALVYGMGHPQLPEGRVVNASAGAILLLTLVATLQLMGTLPPSRHGKADYAFVRNHAGCYAMTVGDFSPVGMSGHAFEDLMPRVLQLDSTRGSGIYDTTELTDTSSEAIHLHFTSQRRAGMERGEPMIRPGWVDGAAWWAPLSASSVRLTWSTGHHGLFAVLNRDGAGYRGVAAGFTDVHPSPVPRAKVTASAVECSRVPPDSARGARLGG